MANAALRILKRPELTDARMVIGLSGWMDGGDVSTGTIEYLINRLDARKIARIDPDPFYFYSFPGSMEVAALFRPHAKIVDGRIEELGAPRNTFYCAEAQRLILFEGQEPNLRWKAFAECLLQVATDFHVTRMCFVGSVAGIVPHTREPRFFASVSGQDLEPLFEQHGLLPSNYEGPASFVTYFTTLAARRGLPLISVVAEIPAYLQGKNAKCIEAATRKVAQVLDLDVDYSELRALTDDFDKRLGKVVQSRRELAEFIRKIENEFDKEKSEGDMAELKTWFERQGIRLD